MKRELKIIISGSSGSGKSTIGQTITQLLEKEGFDVKFHDEPDLQREKKRLKLCIKSLRKEDTKIEISTFNSYYPKAGKPDPFKKLWGKIMDWQKVFKGGKK